MPLKVSASCGSVPTWKPTCMPVSASAAHSGCQSSRFQFGPSMVGDVGSIAILKPMSAVRSTSATAVSTLERRDHRRAHVAGREPLVLDGPVVDDLAAGEQRSGSRDRVHPDPDRRVDELAPDALLVEVLEPQVHVVGARRAVADRSCRSSSRPRPLRNGTLRRNCWPSTWSVSKLTVLVDLAARHPVGQLPAAGSRGRGRAAPSDASRPSWPRSSAPRSLLLRLADRPEARCRHVVVHVLEHDLARGRRW